MEASSLSLLTPCPIITPLGLLLIILQKARGKTMAFSHWSPAQPVNQGCLEDTNVELCPQQDEMLASNTALYNLRTPSWVPALREQTILVFVFQWLLLLFLVLVCDLFPFPHFGVFKSCFIFLLSSICYFGLFYLLLSHPSALALTIFFR